MVHRNARLFRLFFVVAMVTALIPARTARAESPAPVDPDQVVFSFDRGTGDSSVGGGPAAPVVEGDPSGPSALIYAQGKFYILDTLNGLIVEQDPWTGNRRDIPLPEGYFADMAIEAETIYLRDFNRPDLLAVNRASGQAVPAESALGAGEAAPDLQVFSDLTAETKRTDDHQGWMAIFDADGVQLAVLFIQSEHYLGSARLQGRDSLGNYYVMVEELLEDVPEMLVETTVRRYSSDGAYLDAARIPMDEIYFFPNRAVAVDPDGGAYFLKVSRTQVEVVRLGFNAQVPSMLEARWEVLQQSPQYIADAQRKPEASLQAATAITRQQIIQNAKSYMNVNWTLGASNYHTGQADNWDNCGYSKENWRLPRYLTGRVGQTILQVPYAWGGYQSITTFQNRINSGYWAGNICGNQVLGNVAGVDCSGYVSQVLQAGGYYLANNSGLGSISTAINWSQLRPGDLLLKPGSHVMLFDAFANGQNLDGGVWVYESSMRNGTDGVGHNFVSYSTVSSYSPRRYNNVIEDMVPANRNMIRNGDFSGGTAEWGFWAEIDTAVRDGMLYFKRRTPSPNGAAVYQDINAVTDGGFPYEVTANLGNTSNADKLITLNLRNSNTWTGALACSFTIPANTDPKTYRLAGVVPGRWENARFEIGIGSADGLPDLTLDNVSVVYRPDLRPAGVECTVSDPPPASTLWLTPSYSGSGWVKISDQNAVSCTLNNDALFYNRTNRGGDLGAAHWWINVPNPGYYEILAYMPDYSHTMNVTQHARYWIQHADVPAGQPDQLVILDQNQNNCNWVSLGSYRYNAGTNYGIYMGVGNIPSNYPVPNLIAADIVKVVPVGNPDKVNPDGYVSAPSNNSTLVGPGAVTFSAEAWDNASGVASVEFHVKYDGEWHNIGTDPSAPYTMAWNIPANVPPQQMIFTIHVKDRAGNEVLDPGGYRTVNYSLRNLDIGFKPSRDGYSFRNYFDINLFDFTAYDLAKMVGLDTICNVRLGSVCISWKPESMLFFNIVNINMLSGHCTGMSATSLRLFKGLDTLENFQKGAATTNALDQNSVRKYIAYNHVIQYLEPMQEYQRTQAYGTPVEILTRLHRALSNGGSDPQILAMKAITGASHAITPYAIEDKGSGIYWIRVYDNEIPNDDTQYVRVDTIKNEWDYRGGLWGYRGDANKPTIGLFPLSNFNQFNYGWSSLSSVRGGQQLALAEPTDASNVWVLGDRKALLTDESGRRIGWVSGEFINEIPEADWFSAPGDTMPNPKFILPLDMKYTITFEEPETAPLIVEDPAPITIAQIGPGYMVQIDGIDPSVSPLDAVEIAADGTSVAYTSNGAADETDLMLVHEDAGGTVIVRVQGVDISAGGQVLIMEENGRYKIDNSGNDAGQYNVKIEKVVDQSLSEFAHQKVDIESGDTQYLDLASWDGEGSIPLLIDHGSDGLIDATVLLTNYSHLVYVPLIRR
jgi:hypothetical protein